MANLLRHKYNQSFQNASSVVVQHNSNHDNVAVQLLIDAIPDLNRISAIVPDPSDPKNKFTIYFTEELSGTIQVFTPTLVYARSPSMERKVQLENLGKIYSAYDGEIQANPRELTTVPGIAKTPPPSSYLVLFTATLSSTKNKATLEAHICKDGVPVQNLQSRANVTDEPQTFVVAGTIQVDGTEEVTVQWKISKGTGILGYPRLSFV